ncbi:MAG: hypothetical protein ACI9JL_003688 [Paracoccaceae bacterium]|jgi:hypothetical protein
MNQSMPFLHEPVYQARKASYGPEEDVQHTDPECPLLGLWGTFLSPLPGIFIAVS